MRTTNLLPKLEMKSIAVRLSLLFILLSPIYARADLAVNKALYNGKSSLKLDQSGIFTNNDTTLSKSKTGSWKRDKSYLILESKIIEDSTIADTFEIIYNTNQRLSLKKNNQYFTFQTREKESHNKIGQLGKGVLGMVFLVLLAYLISKDRKNINWILVSKGLGLQVILALLILKVPYIEGFFDYLSRAFVRVVEMAQYGATFVFGDFITGEVNVHVKNFATWILPSIIFFSALSSLLYYYGILQRIVYFMAWLMKRLMGLSGAESISAAGNVFLGQTEAPLLVKPYLGKMTKSEILCLMAGGMATIAGGVLAAYIGYLANNDMQKIYFAKHLLTASLMSAPAAIVFAKIILPEKEHINDDLSVSRDKIGINAIESLTNGTVDGLKLAVNVGAMLIAFIAMIYLANFLLGKIGLYTGANAIIASWGHYDSLSFEAILGYSLAPLSWLLGVPWQDCMTFGQLLGEKTILNEFVAYGHLKDLKHQMSDKAILMSTYVLCGFANFASIGIQVGGIGALAPEKKSTYAKYGVLALIAGTLACMSTAVIAGMLF